MKLWGNVLEVSAQDLVISLPHGLRGFVAPKDSSDVMADQLASMGDLSGSDSDSDSDDEKASKKAAPGLAKQVAALADAFTVGQLVRCEVTGLKKKEGKSSGSSIELSLCLSKLHQGLELGSLRTGSALPACVRSVEDHGYLLSFGIAGVSGESMLTSGFPCWIQTVVHIFSWLVLALSI